MLFWLGVRYSPLLLTPAWGTVLGSGPSKWVVGSGRWGGRLRGQCGHNSLLWGLPKAVIFMSGSGRTTGWKEKREPSRPGQASSGCSGESSPLTPCSPHSRAVHGKPCGLEEGLWLTSRSLLGTTRPAQVHSASELGLS